MPQTPSSRVGLPACPAERSSAAPPRFRPGAPSKAPHARPVYVRRSASGPHAPSKAPQAAAPSKVGLLACQAERSSAAPPPQFRPGAPSKASQSAAPSRVGLPAYQAERSSAAPPPSSPSQTAASIISSLPACAPHEPQHQRQSRRFGRAALGLVGQEAYLTEGHAERNSTLRFQPGAAQQARVTDLSGAPR
jgi:hypothetical protein